MDANKIGNPNSPRKPIDHLRAFVASVMEPGQKEERKEESAATDHAEGVEAGRKPFRGRDVNLHTGEDKTLKFVLAGAGGVLVLVFLILGLSHKHTARHPNANTPGPGRPEQQQPSSSSPTAGDLVPKTQMQPAPAEIGKKGKITARDLESPLNTSEQKPAASKPVSAPSAQTLGQIAPFNTSQSPGDTWSPKPYNPQQEQAESQQERAESAGLAKPSLVFVASPNTSVASPAAVGSLAPSLDLGSGTRLSARLPSLVTTAVDLPVVAVVEYSYEQNGEIIVPAGARAVGHIQQADRSGYILIKFDRIEMPDKTEVPIDAVATNRNLGPLKGKVTGTHTGRSLLVRSFANIGSGLAMFAGQNNASGAISEDDLLRAQLAQNIGNAGDQQIMQLMMAEHPIVTVPAGTDIFVVFEKTNEKSSGATPAPSSRSSQLNLNELRELLQIQREMNQSAPSTQAVNP